MGTPVFPPLKNQHLTWFVLIKLVLISVYRLCPQLVLKRYND